MGTITSGVGLLSGMNIDDIVTKLMAIEKMPLTRLQTRIQDVGSQRTAISDLSARVLAIRAALAPLRTSLLFKSTKAASTNEGMIQAIASSGASPGTYRVRVEQLAATQQLVTRGFVDADRTPVGDGTIVLASAQSRLAQQTSLDLLNSQGGVSRGQIRITDRSGASAQVDLSAARTVQDVVQAINTAGGIRVRAEVRGDRLAIVDQSGQTTSDLSVAEVAGGRTAQDLGLLGTVAADELVGLDIHTIGEGSPLSALNDGNGIGNAGGAADMKITAADGTNFTVNLSNVMDATTNVALLNNGQGVRLGRIQITHADATTSVVDLTGAQTIGEVLTRLSADGKVMAVASGNKITISDTLPGTGRLLIEDLDGGHAAADLGIAGESGGDTPTGAAPSIRGSEVYRIRTVGDVLRAINYAAGNGGAVTASLDTAGRNLVLTDSTTGGAMTVEALNGSTALSDLGLTNPTVDGVLTGTRLIATLNTTMLRSINGGAGISQLGQVTVTDRDGNVSTFDFRGARTIDDVLSIFNASEPGGAQIQAELAESGLGIVLRDLSGGSGLLHVADVDGTTAADLKLAGQSGDAVLRGGMLYRQFVSGATSLSDLNGGKGVAAGSFQITDSAGHGATIHVTAGMQLGDLIRQINTAANGAVSVVDGQTITNAHVEARISDSGDGIVITDMAGGASRLRIADSGSTTAADLRIAGQATFGQQSIDGRLSRQITVGGSDSLNTLVAQLNSQAGHLLSAGVINDGSGVSPYRLMLTAAAGGTRGALTIDTGGLALGLDTLVQAQDAVAWLGGSGTAGGIRVVSSQNQLSGVVPNVTLNLTGQTGSYADITVTRDSSTLVKQLGSVADKVSDVLSRIAELTKYSSDGSQRGLLLGDSAIWRLSDSLYGLFDRRVSVGGRSLSLTDLGLTVSGGGATFDEDRFHKTFDADPDSVLQAFTDPTGGLWTQLDKALSSLTDTGTGLLPSRSQALQSQEDLFNKRADDLNSLLTNKQKTLYAQFQAMETALARLQGQQAALTSLASLASSFTNRTGSSK